MHDGGCVAVAGVDAGFEVGAVVEEGDCVEGEVGV